MSRPLEPVSAAGRAATRQAEEVGATWPSPAAGDGEGFPVDAYRALRATGLAAAAVPGDAGGGDVTAVHDLAVIAACLARADGSLGITASMHLTSCWGLARSGGPGVDELLRGVAAGEVWFSAAVTESGTNFFHPATTLRSTGEGWVLEGHKVFATGSPAATHLRANVRVDGGEWHDRLAMVVVPVGLAGVEVIDDWDGLGMAASGSGRVRFGGVRLGPEAVVTPGGPFGQFSAGALQGRAWSNVPNLAAMVGIAEAARDAAVARVGAEGRVGSAPLACRATVRHSVAEMEVSLAAARAALGAIAAEADRFAESPTADLAEAHGFMADFQEAKLVVNRSTVAVVDRALDLSGGAGYLNAHPVSQRYRDVRAGPFMQPFSPHEALGYIGAVATGTEPDAEA